jgi:hypothetical protein
MERCYRGRSTKQFDGGLSWKPIADVFLKRRLEKKKNFINLLANDGTLSRAN